MKKWLKSSFILLLVLLAVPFVWAQAADLSGNGWSYTGTVLTITANISDYNLASSRSDWFIGTPFEKAGIDKEVTEIVIREGVTSIGDLAFYGMGNLTKVTFPSTLTNIGSDTFMNCRKLTEITIPASVTHMGNGAFRGCSGLKKITFKGLPPILGTWSGYYDGVVDAFAFSGCSPDIYYQPNAAWAEGVIYSYSRNCFPTWHMVYEASGDCGANAKWYLLADGTLSIRGSGAMDDYSSYSSTPWYRYMNQIKKITVGDGITRIGRSNFEFLENLTAVSLPPTLKEIGVYAFYCCSTLPEIKLPSGLTTIEDRAFNCCYELKSVKLPASLEHLAEGVFSNCQALTGIDLPDTLKSIGASAFFGTSMMESIEIPAQVTSIGEKASYSSGLTSISIPLSVASIGSTAFTDCPEAMVISCHADSYAAQYAAEFQYKTSLEPHAETVLPGAEVTCTEDGLTEGVWCPVCGKTLAEQTVIAASGHVEVIDKAVAPACTESGLTEGKHCAVCEVVLVKQETVAAAGHSEVIVPGVAATCTEAGLTEGRNCSACGEVLAYQEAIAALGHTEVVDKAVAATCTQSGLTRGKHCSVCQEVLVKQNAIPAEGHTEVTDKAVAATCTETGLTEGRHCSVCQEVLKKQTVVAAKGHTEVTDKAVAATCTETGLTEGRHCSVCQEVLKKQTVVAAKGHTEVTDKAVAATCTETGLTEGRHCSVCQEVLKKQTVVAAKGHTEVTDKAVAATCTETGLTEGRHCSVCQEVLKKQTVVAVKGHTEVTDKAVAATCTETGLTEGRHCSVCQEVLKKQTVVAAKGHTEVVDPAVAPTETETGLTEGKHCSACGEVLVAQEIIPAVGFISEYTYINHGNGTCTITGYTGSSVNLDIPAQIDGLQVTAIGDCAFYDADLETVVIPEGVLWIGIEAFWSCSQLQSVTLPSTLVRIDNFAFVFCSELKELYIPAAATEIGAAFASMPTVITVDSSNPAYKTVDDVLYTADGKELKFCPNFKQGVFAVPDGTESIHDLAFWGSEVTEIHIPASVAQIVPGAFGETHGLERFVVAENSGAFASVNDMLLTKDGSALYAVPMTFTGTLTVPEGVRTIKNEAVRNYHITNVILPDSLTAIEEEAFLHLELETINLPVGLTDISENAFYNCGDFTATVYDGSYAHHWCVKKGIKVDVLEIDEEDLMTLIPVSRMISYGTGGVTAENLSSDGAFRIMVDDEATNWNEAVTLTGGYEFINWRFGVTAPQNAVAHVSITGSWSTTEEIIERLRIEADHSIQQSTESTNSLTLAEYVAASKLLALRNEGAESSDEADEFVHAVMWFDDAGQVICTEKMSLRLWHTTSNTYTAEPIKLAAESMIPNAKGLNGVNFTVADGSIAYTLTADALKNADSLITTQIAPPEGAAAYQISHGWATESVQTITESHIRIHTLYRDGDSLINGVRKENTAIIWLDANGSMLGCEAIRITVTNAGSKRPWPAYAADERWQPLPASRVQMAQKPDPSLLNAVYENGLLQYTRGSGLSGKAFLQNTELVYTVTPPEGAAVLRINHSGGSNLWSTYDNSEYFNMFIQAHDPIELNGSNYVDANSVFVPMVSPSNKLQLFKTDTAGEDWGGVHHFYWYDSLDATEPMLVDWLAYQMPEIFLAVQDTACTTEEELGGVVIAPMFVDASGRTVTLTALQWIGEDSWTMYLNDKTGNAASAEGISFYLPYPDGHSKADGWAYTVYVDGRALRGTATEYGIRFKTEALGTVSLTWQEAQLVEPVPADRIVMDDIPFGMAMKLTVKDGEIHAFIDDEATDWNKVVTFNKPLRLRDPDTGEEWYENRAVNFGMRITAPEDAAYVAYAPGSWASDEALAANLEAAELKDARYSGPGWWNEIAVIEEGSVTTIPFGGEGYMGKTTYAVRWADENGETILIEKVELCFEHTNPNAAYPAGKVLIPAQDILANTTEQSYVHSTVADGSLTYVFTNDWPDIFTLVAAPEGTASYSMHDDFRISHTEKYELVDERYVGYEMYGWPEGQTERTSSDLLCWYDADGRLIGGGWITFTDVYRELADVPAVQFPSAMTAIEEEAFAGMGLQAAVLPEGCVSIGARAFAECTNLQVIHIPASVTDIAEDAFSGCTQLVIITPKESPSAIYAQANGIVWFAE